MISTNTSCSLLSWKLHGRSQWSMTMVSYQSARWIFFNSKNYECITCFFSMLWSPCTPRNPLMHGVTHSIFYCMCAWAPHGRIFFFALLGLAWLRFIREYYNKLLECTGIIKWAWGRWSSCSLSEWESRFIRPWNVLISLVAQLVAVKSCILFSRERGGHLERVKARPL